MTEEEKRIKARDKSRAYRLTDAYRNRCDSPERKAKLKIYHKIWRDSKGKEVRYFYNLKKNLGVTKEQHQEIYKSQNGCCAICGKHESEFKRKLYTDHNHITNKIRGLLCFQCNTLLGNAKDKIEILRNSIIYLEKYT